MGNDALDAYFNSVYKETFSSVSRYVVSKCGSIQESEDIIQNIYARFYQRIAKKGCADIENAEAFVINIAKFECKNYFAFIKKHYTAYASDVKTDLKFCPCSQKPIDAGLGLC